MGDDAAQRGGYADRLLAGSLLVIGAGLLFAVMSALVKRVAAELPVTMVVFFRNAMALLILAPWLLRRHGGGVLATGRLRLHLLRAAAGLGAMYCFFFALSRLPLGEVVLLSFTSPLFIPLIAHLWLKEPVGRQTLAAVAVGFLGVVLILRPGWGVFRPAALVGLGAGLLMALGMVTIRRMSVSEPAVRIVFYFTVLATLISAPAAAVGWRPVPGRLWPLLAAVGVLAVAGQVMLTRGYSLAPASRVGPFTYGNVLFSTLIGRLFWGEALAPLTWAGAVCIFLAGVITSYHRQAPIAGPAAVDLGLRAAPGGPRTETRTDDVTVEEDDALR